MDHDYKKLFGLEFRTNRMKTPDLPLYLTAGREFRRLSNETGSFILVAIPENEKFGVVAFEKQIRQISAKFDMPVALGFETISRAQRDSLIARNIPLSLNPASYTCRFLELPSATASPSLQRSGLKR